MNRVPVSLGLGFGLALAGLVTACGTNANTSPSAPSALSSQASGGGTTGASSIASRSPGKVDVCHVNGQAAYQLLSVAAAAEAAHLGHGDGRVGDPYPGPSGFIFGPTCEAVAAPCGPASGSSGSGSSGC